ncbi:MAG: hypothetical protein E6J47_02230, partial [Chloroflexi bacterium]
MLARTDSRARALSLLIVATVLATLIGGRLAWWQVAQHGWLSEMALNQLAQNEDLPAERGDIRDATGVLLATSVQVQSVFATPPSVTDKAGEAKALGPLLGIDTAQLETLLGSRDPWVWLKRRVDRSVSAVV